MTAAELFLVLAERRLKIDIDAPRLENLDRARKADRR